MLTVTTSSIFWVPLDPPTHITESVSSFSYNVPLNFPPVIVAPGKNLILDSPKAQYKTMDVSVGRDWSATSDKEWCRVVPITGKGNNPKFSITVDENTLGTERKATITFRTYDYKGTTDDNNNKQDTMTVTQAPKQQ